MEPKQGGLTVHSLPYSTRVAIHEKLAAGGGIRETARALGVSRGAVGRVEREGPGIPGTHATISVQTITWALACYFDGMPGSWIRRQLGLTACQLDQVMGTRGNTLPWVQCPICRTRVCGLCLSCILARRISHRP